MSNDKNDGWPAFPESGYHYETTKGGQKKHVSSLGLTIRQYAAIHLQQPDSGTDWLDDMIRKARRDAIAKKVLAAVLSSAEYICAAHTIATDKNRHVDEYISESAYQVADAMLKEGQNKK